MITSIKIGNVDIQAQAQLYGSVQLVDSVKGDYGLKLYNGVSLQQMLRKKLQEKIDAVTNGTYIRSINDTKPADTGNLLLLGSACVSVNDSIDPDVDDPSKPVDQHTLTIFDGCAACSSCQDLWTLAKYLQQIHIWYIGMKDCVLYHQPAAKALWQQQLQYRLSDSSGYCTYQPTIDQSNYRLQNIGRATKLLYQYKAMIAMWNYVVYASGYVFNIQKTPEAYSGLMVSTKRSINFCNYTTYKDIETSFIVTLDSSDQDTQQAQTGSLGFNVKKETQNGTTYIQASYRMHFFVDYVQENTNIDYYSSVNKNLAVTDIDKQIRSDAGISTIKVKIKQKVLDYCQTYVSAAIRIIPVIIAYPYPYPDPYDTTKLGTDSNTIPRLLNKQQYVALAPYSTKFLNDGQVLHNNRWKVVVKYSTDNQAQSKFYQTSYCLYPQQPLKEV